MSEEIEVYTELNPEPCPKCEGDLLSVESSRRLELSVIECTDCGYRIQSTENEDDLLLLWNSGSLLNQLLPYLKEGVIPLPNGQYGIGVSLNAQPILRKIIRASQ